VSDTVVTVLICCLQFCNSTIMFFNFILFCIILYLAVFLISVDTFQSPENRTAETDSLCDDPHKFLLASVL